MLQVKDDMHLATSPAKRAARTPLLTNVPQPARVMPWHSNFKPGSQAISLTHDEMDIEIMEAAIASARRKQQQREGHPALHALGGAGGTQHYQLLHQQQHQQPCGPDSSRPGQEPEQLQAEALAHFPSLSFPLGLSGLLGTDGAATSNQGGLLQQPQFSPLPLQFSPFVATEGVGADGRWFAQELPQTVAAATYAHGMLQPLTAGAQSMLQPAAALLFQGHGNTSHGPELNSALPIGTVGATAPDLAHGNAGQKSTWLLRHRHGLSSSKTIAAAGRDQSATHANSCVLSARNCNVKSFVLASCREQPFCGPPIMDMYGTLQHQLPITKWPRQSGAPVGAAPPTRSQLRLQRHTQVPVQN